MRPGARAARPPLVSRKLKAESGKRCILFPLFDLRSLLSAFCFPLFAFTLGRLITSTAWAQDTFVDSVVSFTPGTNAGFGADQLPNIVLGPPRGAGAVQGSFDVVSLGNDGVIVVGFDQPVICDGPGADFTVFENAFHSGSPSGPIFAEYGIVAVSQDGVNFIEL